MTYDDVIMNRLKQDGIYECVVEMFKAKQGEIERLRAALQDIAEIDPERWDVFTCIVHARNALKEKK